MTRWLFARGLAIVLACGAFTTAQSPAPAPQEGDVFTFRTAGQPERKVKILRIAPFADGESLADVQDVTSGAKYTIPAKVLMNSARSVSRVPEKVSVTPRAEPTKTPDVKQSGFPTSLPIPASAAGARTPFESRPMPKTPATTGTTMLQGLGASLPPMPKPPTVTYPTADVADMPLPVPLPEGPVVPKMVLPPIEDDAKPVPTPTASGPIAPGVIAEPTLEFPIQPPSLVPGGVNPPLATEAPPTPIAEPTPRPSIPVEVTPQPLPIPAQPKPIVPTDLFPTAPVTIVPVGLSGEAASQMIDETTPILRDLTQALRPTVRERAATALAEGRYGWRSEVKAELARSAANDPAPSVRAHCIRLLSKLGYHETAYLDQLAGWAESDSIRVREAAREAMAKLSVRN